MAGAIIFLALFPVACWLIYQMFLLLLTLVGMVFLAVTAPFTHRREKKALAAKFQKNLSTHVQTSAKKAVQHVNLTPKDVTITLNDGRIYTIAFKRGRVKKLTTKDRHSPHNIHPLYNYQADTETFTDSRATALIFTKADTLGVYLEKVRDCLEITVSYSVTLQDAHRAETHRHQRIFTVPYTA